ncbi:MAG: methylthioadenosine phosphorylase [Candidatus Omnitrophica bacterium 4484_70.2]|nr:MAG: methylthioadenosine phosphorylase [Candidatus Omnitrophica bacterium 4484_70.2]
MERIGIIGGSGLYNLEGVKIKKMIRLSTPFGKPSDSFILAEFEGREIVFLPRHGRSHRISPSSINYRANIYGMKKLGVGWIISVSACGSLKEELKPLDFVIPLQFIDRTNQARKYTFFDKGVVVHISFSHPICENLAEKLKIASQKVGVNLHWGGVYLNMEGPQFSTLAESNLYRRWGADIIGMTNLAEARLAREAEICYATLAAVTDYDCWHPQHDSVTAQMVIDNLLKNVERAKMILKEVIPLIEKERSCKCKDALKDALVTSRKAISLLTKKRLKLLIGKYL